jgi:hypothetical protein
LEWIFAAKRERAKSSKSFLDADPAATGSVASARITIAKA